jgi:hypothetical protein
VVRGMSALIDIGCNLEMLVNFCKLRIASAELHRKMQVARVSGAELCRVLSVHWSVEE